MVRRTLVLTVLVGGLLAISLAQAQDRGGRRGGGDFAQMRERMMTGIKDQMGATDEEWKALLPKIEKVMNAQRDLRSFGGFGGRGRGDEGQPRSKVAQAQQDLKAALDNKDTPADDLAKKTAALREAREKARADLQAAQKELKQGATPRQEAALVLIGLID